MSVQSFTGLLTTRKFLLHLVGFVLILVVATLFYVLVEGIAPLKAFYFVVTTITLTGSNYPPSTWQGTIFDSILAHIRWNHNLPNSPSLWTPPTGANPVQRRLQKVSKMQGHIIVAGDPATSRELLRNLNKKDTLVVVEGEAAFNAIIGLGYSTIRGDPSSARLLGEAGIKRCKAVIAASDSDADNAFVCLSAKKIRRDVRVIAKISAEERREKLAAAGADSIVCPPTLALNEITKAVFD